MKNITRHTGTLEVIEHIRPVFDPSGMPASVANKARERAARLWCYVAPDKRTFYVNKDLAFKMQTRTGGTIYPPL